MSPATLARLAFAGSRTDLVRAALTAFAAMLAGLAVLAVGVVLNMAPTTTMLTDSDGIQQVYRTSYRYTSDLLNEPGLRPGLIAMVAALLVPALFLIAQAARLGGPARDRRLAALRIGGATPRQARWIAGAEQGFAVAAGAALAALLYPALHGLLDRMTTDQRYLVGEAFVDGKPRPPVAFYAGPWRPLPTDTAPAWWVWVLLAALPVLAALVSVYALRTVIAEPVAVTRRARRTRARLWPAWLLVAGLAGLGASRAWATAIVAGTADGQVPQLLLPRVGMGTSLAALAVAVPFCAAAIGYLSARLVGRYARRPTTLVAARRVLADPYSGSRALSVLLVAAMMVAIVVGVQSQFAYANEVGAVYGTRFGDEQLSRTVFGLLDGLIQVFLWIGAIGLLVALADRALSRRRTDAAALAVGVPHRTLVKASVGTVLLTAVPGVLLGLAVGTAIPYLALDPVQRPQSVTYACFKQPTSSGAEPTEIPCTAEGLRVYLAQQACFNGGEANCPTGSYDGVRAEPHGPWHSTLPAVEWLALIRYAGLALLAVALATALSLAIGRHGVDETQLRTT